MRGRTMKHGILLIVCLALQSSALAVDFAGGTGEPKNPYQIATAEQLIAVGSNPDLLDKNFVLVADIDLNPNLPGGRVFTKALIAQNSGIAGSSFDGVLDGMGHTISNLHIEGVPGYDAGLFGNFSGLVRELRLADVVISGSPCGAIAGYAHGGMILRCEVTGRISGGDDVGGLVGHGGTRLVECRAHVQVVGGENIGGMIGTVQGGVLLRCQVEADVNGEKRAGGLIGISHNAEVIECQASGAVSGGDDAGGLIGDARSITICRSSADCDVTAEQAAGGLAGSARWAVGLLIADCYARGSVAGLVVGGLTGRASYQNSFVNCYAACELVQVEGNESPAGDFGGLFGYARMPKRAPLTIASFWDTDLSGITESAGSDPLELGTGLTTEQMQDENVLRDAGWGFDHV